MNGNSDESRAWNGTSDVDRESVLSMTMESEASNVAVKVRQTVTDREIGPGGVGVGRSGGGGGVL